jgi:hypothetical protein
LSQLAKPRNKQTRQSGDDIASRPASAQNCFHGKSCLLNPAASQKSAKYLSSFPTRRINTGKDMAYPSEPHQPEQSCYYEMHQRREDSTLHQLTQPRNKKARKRRDNVTR